MDRPAWIAAYRVFFALLTVGTIIFRLIHNSRVDPDFSVANFFSLFTIQSNLFAAAVLLSGGFGLTGRWRAGTADLIRGAAVVYLATTGVVYGVLLADTAARAVSYVGWADTVVHRIMPVVMVADWLIAPPRTRLTLRGALVWLIYPLLYLVYSLIRGAFTGWYPYPFLTPASVGGYGGIAAYGAGIALFILLVSWLTVSVANMHRRFRRQADGLPGQAGDIEPMV